jgi:hypothetical protein
MVPPWQEAVEEVPSKSGLFRLFYGYFLTGKVSLLMGSDVIEHFRQQHEKREVFSLILFLPDRS